MTSFTTDELRNILTPIHSRIDDVVDVLNGRMKGKISHQLRLLEKCDKALRKFNELMNQRELENQNEKY